MALSDESMIKSVAEACTTFPALNTTYEIVCRITTFITFLSGKDVEQASTLEHLFRLLAQMLELKNQADASFHVICASIAFFVRKFIDQVFKEQTTLVIEILKPVVTLTSRKLLAARAEAVGFILWLLDKEAAVRPDMTRCALAIEYAVCRSAMGAGEPCIPFWSYLPEKVGRVATAYDSLLKAKSAAGAYENQIQELLRVYNDFKNFPSIRASIYAYIVQINEKNKDFCSAFVAQWKLSALIAEVFKLRNQVIDGIPSTGNNAFRFVVNEPEVDLSVYPEDSSYIVLQSEKFNEEALSQSLQDAMKLCQQAGLHWLIGDITEILFTYLEKQRSFTLLNQLYDSVRLSFAELQKTESARIGFARIFCSGVAAEKLQFTHAVHLYPRLTGEKQEGYTQFVSTYCKAIIGKGLLFRLEDDAEPLLTPPRQNMCQMVYVKPDRQQLLQMNASVFRKDVLDVDAGWDKPIVRRYLFETETPLPGCSSVVNVKSVETTTIVKAEYYRDKLTKFRDRFNAAIVSIEAVLPPPKMAKTWGKSISGVGPSAILKFIKKISEAQPKTHPYYCLVKSVLEGANEESPAPIEKLIGDIKEMFIRGIRVAQRLAVISAFLPAEQTLVDQYTKYLGITNVGWDFTRRRWDFTWRQSSIMLPPSASA
jgi:hypothetical protein